MNDQLYKTLSLLERLPAEITGKAPYLDTKHPTPTPIIKPAATAHTEKKRGRPATVYDNSALVTYYQSRQYQMPDWLEDIISGSLTWRDSGKDTAHKLSPALMCRIVTSFETISTDQVLAGTAHKPIKTRAAQYYVKGAVAACKMALAYLKSDQWKPDIWDQDEQDEGQGPWNVEADWSDLDEWDDEEEWDQDLWGFGLWDLDQVVEFDAQDQWQWREAA